MTHFSSKVFAFMLFSMFNCGLDSLSDGLATGILIQISFSGVLLKLTLKLFKLPLLMQSDEFVLIRLAPSWLLLLVLLLLLLVLDAAELAPVDTTKSDAIKLLAFISELFVSEARSFSVVFLNELRRFK